MQTPDRQTETGDYFFRSLGVMKRRENLKLAIRPSDSIIICTSLAFTREVKRGKIREDGKREIEKETGNGRDVKVKSIREKRGK